MAGLLGLLFEITALFDMQTRPELLLLQKTMVVVEGVARTLDPALDMWTIAEPVVRAWMVDNLGPLGKIEEAARGVRQLLGLASRLPALLTRLEQRLEDEAEHTHTDKRPH
jgi:ubiquinone biosynthesis protein